ncbi:MAG: T9SS type A sorting domain-containing protein [Limnohabitans sp.]|nr:T9SS type A sorting domain-containing protein [Limnohabitans sp.]
MTHFFKSSIKLLLSGLFVSTFGHAQDIIWEKSYGGKNAEYLFDAIPTPDFGFILSGSSISSKSGNKEDNNKGNYDYWLWKMNEKGELDWQKSFGGSDSDFLQSVLLTLDGGLILGGTSNSNAGLDKKDYSKGNSDFWIIKLDAKGTIEWQKTIGGNGLDKLARIAKTTDGGYIVGGSSESQKSPLGKDGNSDKTGKNENSRGSLDFWILKLNKNGDIEWQKTIGGEYVDELTSIEQTKDGGYIAVGYSNSSKSGEKLDDSFGESDYWVIKLNNSGNIEWQKTIGGNREDCLYSLVQTKNGKYLLGGNSNSATSGSKKKGNGRGTDFWLVQLDEKGEIIWQQTYDFGKLDILTSMVENKDGTFAIGGYAQSEASRTSASVSRTSANGAPKTSAPGDKEGINDYIALKISATGETLWSKTVGSKNDEILTKLLETRDGGYLMAGTSFGGASRDKNNAMGGSDFWVVKLKDKSKPEKEKITIEALPNPIENFTNIIINFDYTEGTATLYDINGRRIQEEKITGLHTIPLSFSNLPTGIYIVSINTNTNNESIKVIKK